jgi:hypothetical protein
MSSGGLLSALSASVSADLCGCPVRRPETPGEPHQFGTRDASAHWSPATPLPLPLLRGGSLDLPCLCVCVCCSGVSLPASPAQERERRASTTHTHAGEGRTLSGVLAPCPSLLWRRPRTARMRTEGASTKRTRQAESRAQHSSTDDGRTRRTATPWKDERRRKAVTFGGSTTPWTSVSHHCATGASGRCPDNDRHWRMEESSIASVPLASVE